MQMSLRTITSAALPGIVPKEVSSLEEISEFALSAQCPEVTCFLKDAPDRAARCAGKDKKRQLNRRHRFCASAMFAKWRTAAHREQQSPRYMTAGWSSGNRRSIFGFHGLKHPLLPQDLALSGRAFSESDNACSSRGFSQKPMRDHSYQGKFYRRPRIKIRQSHIGNIIVARKFLFFADKHSLGMITLVIRSSLFLCMLWVLNADPLAECLPSDILSAKRPLCSANSVPDCMLGRNAISSGMIFHREILP
jgi:hypothetical protein